MNCFKIQKLKKLKLNKFYQECKKDYQRLNNAGKKRFENFNIYKTEWQVYNNVYKWSYCSGRSNTFYGLMGFYMNAKWHGYHTQDFNSWLYMATQMECDEWVKKYKLKQRHYSNAVNSSDAGLGFLGGVMVGGLCVMVGGLFF